MSTVSFGGLATGLDTATLISQLVALRRQPILRLQEQKSLFERQRAALTDLKTKLTALMDAADAIDTPQSFGSLRATSSATGTLTATADTEAQQGTYTVTVDALAAAQKDISQGFTSQVAEVGTGTFTITVGGEVTEITLAEGASSLTSLKNAINDAGAGVRATIINDGTDTTPYRLVLTADETGTDAAFSVDFSNLSGGTAPVLTNITTAANASLTIDTVEITSQSNTVANALEGVTLDLLKADPDAEVTVTLNIDKEAIAKKIEVFVDAYNALRTYIDAQQQKGATLQGNSTVRSIESRISSLAVTPLSGGSGAYTLLAHVGITQGEDGQLEFDDTAFNSALDDDYSSVRDLFVERGTNLGKAYLFRELADGLTDSKTGQFKITNDAFDEKAKAIDKRIERMERSVESYRQVLEKQFIAMELMVAKLSAQSSYLSMFSGLY